MVQAVLRNSDIVEVINGANGGTGVANTGRTITLAGNLTLSGAFALTLTQTGATNVTLPTTGTLATLAGAESLTNKNLNSGTNTFPTFNQNTTGSAGTLSPGRNINGTAFNGSADITITAAAGTLTGTTLNATVVTTSITSTGTITSGTWSSSITSATIDSTTTSQAKRPTNAQTGTTYTLLLTDAGKMVTLSNAAAITLTVPPQSSVTWTADTEIDLAQLGAGQVTVAPGSGVTINSYTAKTKLAGQYAGGTLKRIVSDQWLLIGNLA